MKVCSQCQKSHNASGALCEPCRDYAREYATRRRANRSVCRECGSPPTGGTIHCDRHRFSAGERVRKLTRKYKEAILEAYGAHCSCCGESHFEFLSLDHINGGGTKHRRAKGTVAIYKEVIDRGFPNEFRVLCLNCNLSLGFYGYCPHRAGSRQGRRYESIT